MFRPTASVLVLVVLAVSGRADAALQLTLKGYRATSSSSGGSTGDTTTDAGILSVSYALAEWISNSSVVKNSSKGGQTKTLTSSSSGSEADTTASSTTKKDEGLTATTDVISFGGLIVGVTSGSLKDWNYVDTSKISSSTDGLIGDVSKGGTGSSGAYTNPFALTPQVGLTGGGGGTPGFGGIGTAVVPEPGVIGLLTLGMGLLGLGSLRQRRKLATAPPSS